MERGNTTIRKYNNMEYENMIVGSEPTKLRRMTSLQTFDQVASTFFDLPCSSSLVEGLGVVAGANMRTTQHAAWPMPHRRGKEYRMRYLSASLL